MDNSWTEKLAIQELFARYAHAVDNLEVEPWVQCFTPDGVFQVGNRAMRGEAGPATCGPPDTQRLPARALAAMPLVKGLGPRASDFRGKHLPCPRPAGGPRPEARGPLTERRRQAGVTSGGS